MSTFKKAIQSSWTIIKIVIPIYILADILYFYNTLAYISFLIDPFTSMLNLPREASLAIISGMFLNLYAAVAFAAPLDMDAKQWSILAIFLGICHSLIAEGAVVKKLGIPYIYSYSLRIIMGFIIAYLATLIPERFFSSSIAYSPLNQEIYTSIYELLYNSIYNAIILTIEIVILVSLLIFIMDFIKNMNFIKQSTKNISKYFSIMVGLLLGITYGAGILISESSNIKKSDMFLITTFLMICHAVIEDTLLFAILGSDFMVVVAIRLIWAFILAFSAYKMSQYKLKDKS
jgi:hypothetical protein